MKIKSLLLTFLLVSTFVAISEQAILRELSITLPQLETKAAELNKMSELKYKKFYSNLGKAISKSLTNKNFDSFLFDKLPINTAKQAAEYIVKSLLNLKPAYTKSSTFETEEGTTVQEEIAKLTIKFEGYKPLTGIPVEDITNQIVLISKIVDHIVSQAIENEETAILSNDIFDSIFYSLFAQALKNAKHQGKLRLIILSNTLDDKDFESIKKTFEDTENKVIHYKTRTELTNDRTRFNIFLFNPNATYGTNLPNVIRAQIEGAEKPESLFTLIGTTSKQVLAFIPTSIPNEERNALFDYYINTQLDTKEAEAEPIIKDYHWDKININYLDLAFRISISADWSKTNLPLFVLNNESSEILDITLPIEQWPNMGYIVASVINSYELRDTNIYIFNKDSQEFLPIDSSIMSKVKVREIS